VRLQGNSHA